MFMIMAEEFGCWRLDQNPASDSRALQEIGPFIFACPFKLESVIIIVCQGGPRSSPAPANAVPGSSDSSQASCPPIFHTIFRACLGSYHLFCHFRFPM